MSVQTSDFADTQGVAEGPLVSVVIPTRNRPQLLEQAIRSVLAQTHKNLDVIVVDDASTEDMGVVISRFNDARLRYVRHLVNKGGSAARNTGIRAAHGEYIAFLDDDDEWEPWKTTEQLRLLRHFDAVLCAYWGEELGVARRYQGRPTVDLDELKYGFFRGGGTSALMVRAALMRELLFDESLPRFQDWDMCIRLAQRTKIGYVPRPLVKYNDGAHLRISNKFRDLPPAALEEELRMVRKHREFFGAKLFRFHMSCFLLHDIKQRRSKTAFVAYVLRRYGVGSLVSAVADRVYTKLIQKQVSA